MKSANGKVLVSAKPMILERYVSSLIPAGCTVLEALQAAQKQEVPAGDHERLRSRQQLGREMSGSWSVFALTCNGQVVELDPKQPVSDLPGEVLVSREVDLPGGDVTKVLTLKLEVQSYQAVGVRR